MRALLRSPIPRTGIFKHVSTRGLLTAAFVRGPAEPPLLTQTIGEHFAGIVKEHGDRPAVISRHQRKVLRYHDLDRDSTSLARGLVELGVEKGSRVAVSLGNNVEFAVLTYALFKLGAILVPLNPAFTPAQVIAALNHLTASHLIISTETNLPYKPPRSNIDLLTQLTPNINSTTPIHSETVPSLTSIILVDNSSGRLSPSSLSATTPFNSLLQATIPSYSPPPDLHPTDIATIQFTSGTTSTPKAACLSHTSILNNGFSIGSRMLLSPTDLVACPPPLFHCFGCILGYMATATHGSAIVFPAESFDAKATLAAVQEYGCTALYGVPTMFIAELDLLSSGEAKREGLEKLRTGIAAGSSIPASLMERLHKELNLTELTICYGMTETSPVSAMTTTDDPIRKRVESVGRALPHVWVKVVEPGDWGRTVGVGERGELAVAGYLVMKGYWGDEKRTGEVLRTDGDGVVWMHTGDEGSIDEDGYIKITGRIKDLIIRGGENIHPLEIENILLAHPAISDVSVVGLPDQRHGEAVAAFVIVRQGSKVSAQDVREWVKKTLSHHLVPKYVFWVDGYPKTASGKIQKFKLREIGRELLDRGEGL